MKKQKELEVFGGVILRKSFFQHFELHQEFYGSPYHYIVKYDDESGDTSDTRYGLWKFNMDTLQYELYETADKKAKYILDDLADKWEKEEWAARKREKQENEQALYSND